MTRPSRARQGPRLAGGLHRDRPLGGRATLHAVDTADHGCKILKRSRASEENVFVEMARVVREWAPGLK